MGGHCPYSYSSHWLIPCRQGGYWCTSGAFCSGVRPGALSVQFQRFSFAFPTTGVPELGNGMGVSPLRAQPRNLWSKSALKKPLRPLAGEGSQLGLSRFRALPGCDGKLSTSALRLCHLPPPQRKEDRGTRTVEVTCDPWPPRCEKHREDSTDGADQVFSSRRSSRFAR